VDTILLAEVETGTGSKSSSTANPIPKLTSTRHDTVN
jgi:hypothetical protein